MGSLLSRLNNQLNNAEEEVDHHPVYKYPPKSGWFVFAIRKEVANIFTQILQTGNFFASNFIMGGERFDQATPESYLFGENADLNWLGSKPISVSVKNRRFLPFGKILSYFFSSFHIFRRKTRSPQKL